MKMDVTIWNLVGPDRTISRQISSDIDSLIKDLSKLGFGYSDAAAFLEEFVADRYEDDADTFIEMLRFDEEQLWEDIREYLGDDVKESFKRRYTCKRNESRFPKRCTLRKF